MEGCSCRLDCVIGSIKVSRCMALSLLLIGALVVSHGHSTTVEDDLTHCNAIQIPLDCQDNTACNVTLTYSNTAYKITFTINDTSLELCPFFACCVNNTELSCALYNISCESIFCQDDDDNENNTDETQESGDTDAVLLALMVIFLVAFLVASFVILTLALMVRDMRNERIQDGLPNPYSCVFSAVGLLCSALPCGRGSSDEDELEGEGKPPVKTYTKPRKEKEASAPQQSHRKEKQPAQSDPESPDHDADDYEEMEQAMKRDSFQDDGPEDIYQNQ